jgi:hypothetical protein
MSSISPLHRSHLASSGLALVLGASLLVGCGDQKDPNDGLTQGPSPTTPSNSSDESPGPVDNSSDTPSPSPSPGGETSGPAPVDSSGTGDDPSGDTSNTDEPTSGPVDETSDDPSPTADQLCPMKDGATWTYFHSSNKGWNETETVTRADYNGKSAFVVADTPNPKDSLRADSYHIKEGGRLLRVFKKQFWVNATNGVELLDSDVTYDPGFLRCDEAWLTKEVGFTESPEYQRAETPANGAAKAPDARKHSFTIEAREDISVQGGKFSFKNCVKIRRGKDWAATSGEDVEEKLYWFCPGVGKVREENVVSGNYEELVDYKIP